MNAYVVIVGWTDAKTNSPCRVAVHVPEARSGDHAYELVDAARCDLPTRSGETKGQTINIHRLESLEAPA